MCNGIIYKAENKINGKVYIGKTIKSLRKRKRDHIGHAKRGYTYYFHNALKKHGEKNFKWIILAKADSEKQLNQLEKFYIAHYREIGEIYNLTDGGDGSSGFNHSEKTKKKMSKSQKGNKNSLGYKHTEEHKRKLSETLKSNKHGIGHRHTEETRSKMSESHKGQIPWSAGKHLSDETKRKISKALKGKNITLETRLKMSLAQSGSNNAMYGKKVSTETRLKMSEAHKGRTPWNKGKKGKAHTEEQNKKISESLKARRERELRCA